MCVCVCVCVCVRIDVLCYRCEWETREWESIVERKRAETEQAKRLGDTHTHKQHTHTHSIHIRGILSQLFLTHRANHCH